MFHDMLQSEVFTYITKTFNCLQQYVICSIPIGDLAQNPVTKQIK